MLQNQKKSEVYVLVSGQLAYQISKNKIGNNPNELGYYAERIVWEYIQGVIEKDNTLSLTY